MPATLPLNTSTLLPAGTIYKALGTCSPRGCEKRYVIAVPGELRSYRGAELHGLAFLFDLYPSAAHWRALWPAGGKTQIEARAACADIIRECQEAGEYDLPDEIRPKPGRRLPKRDIPTHAIDPLD